MTSFLEQLIENVVGDKPLTAELVAEVIRIARAETGLTIQDTTVIETHALMRAKKQHEMELKDAPC